MPLEKLIHCPLCKSGLFLNHTQVKDHSISGEIFYICRCSQCGLLFTNPRPDLQDMYQYYDSPTYVSHQNKSNSLVNLVYKAVRVYTMRKKVGILNRYSTKKGSLLDYGCGTGHFLKAAKSDQWKVTGIEPNDTARNTSKKSGIKTFTSIEELKKHKKFDVITLFHVLEHIHTLRATVKSILNHLTDEGKLMVAVPNHLSFDAQHYQEHWAAWDIPRHLYHFNQSSIQSFAAEFKMEIESILPMKLDSYYVSILSEKYRSPETNNIKTFLNGLKIGYKSNSRAEKNHNDYSSLLFILKKK